MLPIEKMRREKCNVTVFLKAIQQQKKRETYVKNHFTSTWITKQISVSLFDIKILPFGGHKGMFRNMVFLLHQVVRWELLWLSWNWRARRWYDIEEKTILFDRCTICFRGKSPCDYKANIMEWSICFETDKAKSFKGFDSRFLGEIIGMGWRNERPGSF